MTRGAPPTAGSSTRQQSRGGPAAGFGERVREARRRLRTASGRRWTQGDLGSAVGVERNTVSRWENGGVRPKDPATLASLARALRVSTDWLIEGRSAAAIGGSTGGAGGAASIREAGPNGTGESPVSVESLPASARDIARGYLARLAAAGCGTEQLEAAAALLARGASNAVSRTPYPERRLEDVMADLDAAWDFVVRVLRRDGIRP